MSYPKEIIAEANAITSRRRHEAEEIQKARHAEIAEKLPDVLKYEAQLAQTGIAVVKSLTMGENAKKYIKELSELNLRIQSLIKKELESAGYPSDYLETPYTCKACSDTGFKDGVACYCRKKLLSELNVARLEKCSPAKYCRFSDFDVNLYDDEGGDGYSPRQRMSDVLEYCKCYADDFGESSCSLYMYGATGLGKTHLSLAIANEAARKGFNVLYYSAQNLFSALEKEKFTSGAGTTEADVEDCDLLIIDDLGSEYSTRFTVSALYNIINTRLNLSKPSIISTNLSITELEKTYDQRIASRIIGNYQYLLFEGRDIRQIKSNVEE